MSVEESKQIVRRYYNDLWNRWNLAVIEEIIAPQIEFRGSLGVSVRGLAGFKAYVSLVREAFPDFKNTIEELIAEDNKVVAHLTYTGTHRGEIFGIAPTAKPVTYSGMAIFTIADGKIQRGWVLGDVTSLKSQLMQG